MILSQIKLTNFRNYSSRVFEVSPNINVIWGKNASGKTNLLEAVYLLATGNSFKAKVVDEMVLFGQELGRVTGMLNDLSETRELEVLVTKGEVGGQKTLKRKYFLDGVSKRKKDYLGAMTAVIFRPEDMDMLTGGSDIRRGFMDDALSQVSESYARSLSTYIQALRRRNKLLDAIREGLVSRYSLAYWDGLLIKHGMIMTEERERLTGFINNLWSRSELFNHLKIVYDKSLMSEARLEQYRDEELAAGYTLVGPHKDDFRVTSTGGRDLAVYGSRGEQRMAVLALKLGEIYFSEDQGESKPILLLDDIFSELDEVHKKEVLRVMLNRQVIVTTAMKEDVTLFSGAKIVEIVPE